MEDLLRLVCLLSQMKHVFSVNGRMKYLSIELWNIGLIRNAFVVGLLQSVSDPTPSAMECLHIYI